MKLYTAPFAPNPTKVEIYLRLRRSAGAPFDPERITVNLFRGEQREGAHLLRNPFGSLPVLELEDGFRLTESLAIIDFFEDRFPIGALRPSNHFERARAREVERIADVRLGAALTEYVHADSSPLGKPHNGPLALEFRERLDEPLDYFDLLLCDGRTHLLGTRVSVADCTLAAFLNFGRLVGEDFVGERPALKRWFAQFSALEPVKQAMSI